MSSPLWGGDFLCRFGSCAHVCPHALCTLALTHTQYLDAHIAPTQFMCAPIMRPLASTYAHNSHMDAHTRPQHVHASPHSPHMPTIHTWACITRPRNTTHLPTTRTTLATCTPTCTSWAGTQRLWTHVEAQLNA